MGRKLNQKVVKDRIQQLKNDSIVKANVIHDQKVMTERFEREKGSGELYP